jgi:phosphopantothenoylcysteine decarboxylase / phosphopantothenate---cysteine ligase
MILEGKKILLGVTGGIAAYKCCELLRQLQKQGAEVRVAMTPAATEFVGSMTFASLSGFPVYLAGPHSANTFRHIDYPRWADLYVVAPASANSIARFVAGFAEEPVSMCWAAALVPKIVVPAMNFAMFQSPANQRNLATLRADGVRVVEPEAGRLACGEEGQGRFPPIETILAAIRAALAPAPNGRSVLITAGRTEEAIDPVRYISNRSSGKTAAALASAFMAAGFQVNMVHGPMEATIPEGCSAVFTRSARDMHAAVLRLFPTADAVVHCAAVADYRPAQVASEKIKDSRSQLELALEPNPNILRDTVAQKKAGQVVVGFALETEKALEHAQAKRAKSGADLIVVNTPVRPDSGFGCDAVEFALVGPDGPASALRLGPKEDLARGVVEFVKARLESSRVG